MSKFTSLFHKVEAYEKLSVYGSRTDFLKSLAIDYHPVDESDLKASIDLVRNAVQNWINTSAERQADLPGGQVKGLPPGLRGPYQVVRATNTFDVKSLPPLYQALLGLSTINNLGNMGGSAKSAWLSSVFPLLGTAMQKVKQQMAYYTAWTHKYHDTTDGVNENPTQNAVHSKTTTLPVTEITGPAKPKSMNEEAKSLSKLLSGKISKLPTSKNKSADLLNINENVKSLQRYFRALQTKNDLQSYFARLEIVKALQNAYNSLDYNDLDQVSALNAGQGVPETPDSKV